MLGEREERRPAPDAAAAEGPEHRKGWRSLSQWRPTARHSERRRVVTGVEPHYEELNLSFLPNHGHW